MKNDKAPGTDGIHTEFKVYFKSTNPSLDQTDTTSTDNNY